jgi:hypothetical protein
MDKKDKDRIHREAKKRVDEMIARDGVYTFDPNRLAEGADKVIEALDYILYNMTHSSFVGLFWFKKDYSDIDGKAEGCWFFTDEDIAAKRTILPEDSHSTHKACSKKLPGVRVELNEGVVTITIGEKCPDSVIEKIIGRMSLEKYREGIKVIRVSYWDDL